MKATQEYFDKLVKMYEVKSFIADDPVQYPHKFNLQQDVEISALIASTFAYGKREKIIEYVGKIHDVMQQEPYNFVLNYNFKKDAKLFKGMKYRYNSEKDIQLLVYILHCLYKEHKSMEDLFKLGFHKEDTNIKKALNTFIYNLKNCLSDSDIEASNIHYCLPSPDKNSACKRLNLFLKWMMRPRPVDLGVWKSIPTSKLVIPLDTHVARLSRKFELTHRKSNDWKTAEEITEKLKVFDANDPTKYDFALFGHGIALSSK